MGKRGLLAVIGLMALFLFISSVRADDLSACGTLTAGKQYDLINDINSSSGASCLVIKANDFIDCHGHKIINNGTTTLGIYDSGSALTNLTIANCIIENFTYLIGVTGSDDVVINNVTFISRGASDAFFTTNTKDMLVVNSSFYDMKNYVVSTVSAVGNFSFINNNFYSVKTFGSITGNVTFEGNRLYNSTGSLYYSLPTNFISAANVMNTVFKNNTIYNYDFSTSLITFTNSTKITISNNTFGNSTNPIFISRANNYIINIVGGDSVEIFNNRFYALNSTPIHSYGSASSNISNMTISDNYLEMSGTMNVYGLTMGSDYSGTAETVKNSFCYNNFINSSITDGGSHSLMIKNNINSRVYNNTVVGGYFGVVFKDNLYTNFTNNSIHNASLYVFHDKGSENCLIKDNLFHGGSLTDHIIHVYMDNTLLRPARNNTYQDNVISNSSGFSGNSVYLASNSSNITFINMSYNDAEVMESDTSLIREWYLDSSSNVAGTNLTLFNSSGILYSALSPNFERQTLVTYINTAGVIVNQTYTLNATASGYSSDSETLNMNNNLNVDFTLTDTIGPEVTLVSPLDGYSETASSSTLIFQFNVSDVSNVSNCTVYYTGGAVINTTLINESLTNNISITLPAGTYSWYVNCTDTLGNIGNSSSRTLSILALANANTGSAGTLVYSLSKDNLNEGYSKIIRKFSMLSFEIDKETHELTLRSINFENRTITITLSSETKTKILKIGEIWKNDFNNDSYYDLLIEVNNITSTGANLSLRHIHELVLVNDSISNTSACFGCYLSGRCYPLAFRLNQTYCSSESIFVDQSENLGSCDNHYQCKSNYCAGGFCRPGSLLWRFLNRLARLFTWPGSFLF